MINILRTLTGRGLHLTRRLHRRTQICQKPGVFVHPELRRTIPLVYFRKGELPPKANKEVPSKRQCEISPLEKNRKSTEAFDQFCKRQRQCFSSTYQWAEFRRKMIYGSY
ncbi:uncharacterized protein LOC6739333 [Drosophila simulans]|uniref:GD15287 n=1 Tax=Drosophila simulans TaxID=7240 RepID=B4NS87_DROSI|nr:uncharacterized protein LOC6739333 [Drosophila simulans]EDX15465.1 GD15287 [Drosophila simulans]KMY92237.1 uncharacterized protein Dsimw501_GD15287 [Drosophila simulans]